MLAGWHVEGGIHHRCPCFDGWGDFAASLKRRGGLSRLLIRIDTSRWLFSLTTRPLTSPSSYPIAQIDSHRSPHCVWILLIDLSGPTIARRRRRGRGEFRNCFGDPQSRWRRREEKKKKKTNSDVYKAFTVDMEAIIQVRAFYCDGIERRLCAESAYPIRAERIG